jgi:hypothetical protein
VGWQPAYNLIDVRVEGDGANRTLVVDAHQLQWQANPELYRPALSPTGEEVFRHRIPIPGRLRGSISALPSAPEELPRPNDVEAAMSEEATRNLVSASGNSQLASVERSSPIWTSRTPMRLNCLNRNVMGERCCVPLNWVDLRTLREKSRGERGANGKRSSTNDARRFCEVVCASHHRG